MDSKKLSETEFNKRMNNNFLVTKKVFHYKSPYPYISKKGELRAVFKSRIEAENFVIEAEEKAFKGEQLYMLLKNEKNEIRVREELLSKFDIDIYQNGILNFDFKIPDHFSKEEIIEVKRICSDGFYNISELDKSVKGFLLKINVSLGDSDDIGKLNRRFDEKSSAEIAVLTQIKYQIKYGFGDYKFLMGESLNDLTTKVSELEEWLMNYSSIFNFEEGYGYAGKKIGYLSDEVYGKSGLYEVEELMEILEPKVYEIIEL